ncbi:cell death abnormality protein 1-like [Crassostrea angulata]|uniref:cell death abnormality protein 1-like n=1 Tax=Magallana angulata TaxID=2784310 RepID=UPI00148A3D6A|nr:cell death abnormality protein 1-like [Crassostrea gigas]XP_052707793.1 cell death abnormality protein 1-like [Crassostrea angulata]
MFNQVMSIAISQLFYFSAHVFFTSIAKECPVDKHYNPTIQNCTDCPSGYYGSNCWYSCRYPGYGVECQKECHCPKKACNHVIGCLDYALDDKERGREKRDTLLIKMF